jgi:hypothetical protein
LVGLIAPHFDVKVPACAFVTNASGLGIDSRRTLSFAPSVGCSTDLCYVEKGFVKGIFSFQIMSVPMVSNIWRGWG